ncbi:hypothetical protein [Ramlibacter sp.]|uniref:hypothetical protein n=1 Tax=Ramlibacter sp. TaxID=1917967 RepID=UPI002BEB9AA3|nr:hypothetical protein [Ramlibacter sp.]HWI81865.1 hypothetical protein [Ramlibacter sp.]
MSSSAYYLICLAAGLLAIAAASAGFVWRLRARERQLKAVELLDALARYTEWMAAQGRAVCFQAATQPPDGAVQEIGALQQQWFPALAPQMQRLLHVHLQLARLLRMHERMRPGDPEAWLERGHDASFMRLWREHCAAAQGLEQVLLPLARTPGPRPTALRWQANASLFTHGH